jgi:hypothetical protein
MSVILRCTNDNGVIQDIQVQDQLDLRLDISAIENTTIGDVYGISSQDFSLVGSNEVNQFFGNLYNLGTTPAIALQNSIPCQVLFNGAEVFKGKLYIKNIITDSEGYNSIYNVIVVNETVDFKFEIQDLYINQLNLSQYNHDLTYTNISSSWGGGLLNGNIVYPFVNYGKPEGDADAPDYAFASYNSTGSNTFDSFLSPLRLIDFKPTIRAKAIVDAIFSGSSYQYTSSFFNSEYFEDLYVLPTANDQLGPNNTSPVSQSAWAYNASGSQQLTNNSIAKVEFDAEVIDNANNFSLVNERYTADTVGNYQYQINIGFTIGNWAPSPTDRVGIQLRKNGTSLINSQQYISPSQTGSAFLQGATSLIPGDYLEVELFFRSTNNTRFLTIRNDQGQPSYYPLGYITYFQIKGPASLLGGEVDMGEQFPDDLKALDFLQGLIEKFNLVVEPVPNTRNLIRVEPYQDWIDSGKQVDWTNKVDRNERFEITHPILEQPRSIIFSDEDDDDILNKYTLENKGRTFGSYTFVSDSDLAEGERRIGKVFAATPVTGIPNGRPFIVPHLCSVTENRQFRPIKFKPRLLYNNGIQTVPGNALGISGSTINRGTIFIRDENSNTQKSTVWNQMSTLTAIPVNYNTGQDLHFNNDQYTQYFQSTANGKVKGDAYRGYWATYINSLYDIDARKLVCSVYLKPTEIQNIALNDKIFIDGQYYRINRINGANLTRRDTVEVELIKIIAQQLKFPRRRVSGTLDITLDYNSLSINGTGRYININSGDTVDEYNLIREVAAKDYMQLYNFAGTASVVWDYQVPTDTTNQFDQATLGTNDVAVGASKVSTLGNNNIVKEGTETSFIIGSENFIGENTSNVTIIGQGHNVDDESQNAQIIGGINGSISGSVQSTIVGSFDTTIVNSDYAISINGDADTIRDSDFITAINSHNNEVIINGSGHVVIGLNLEGAGLDLLEYRNNSNWLGDTYLGESIFLESSSLNLGDGTSVDLSDTQYRHSSLYVLNWNGLSPGTASITLPSYVNDDYTKSVYTFKANGTFDGTTRLEISGFSGQTIEGATTYALSSSYDFVTLYGNQGNWLVLNSSAGGGAAPGPSGSNTINVQYTGSLVNVASTLNFTGSGVTVTSSGSTATIDITGGTSVSASFATSASYALSASFATSASRAVSASFATSASYAFQATSASFAISASQAVSASYALSSSFATSASAATSASYAPNIYNSNGKLDDNRTVDLFGSNLIFSASSGEDFIIASSPGSTVTITDLAPAVSSNIIYYNTSSGQLTYGAALSGSITGSGNAFPFTGSAQITGSLGVTGSYSGNIVNLTTVNSTASLDLAAGNAFAITLVTGSTYISASNINPNQKISLLISSSVNNAIINFNENQFYFPSAGNPYVTTATSGSRDILTFETYTFNPNVVVNTSINKNLTPALQFGYIIANGGTVTTSGSFKIHTFTTSGTFSVTGSGFLSEFLVVAGGGGGGSAHGGGGGGGGLIYDNSAPFIAPGNYTVTIGAGGSGGAGGGSTQGSNGSNSVFDSNTALGGGGGGAYGFSGTVSAGQDGGSGGGGGGAGVVGASADSGSFGPEGGDGLAYDFTGSSVYYAGGGGGGAYTVTFGGRGGLGGGGNGGNQGNNVGLPGDINTGGGGGGGSDFTPGGGNGGSGIVIIKYRFQD